MTRIGGLEGNFHGNLLIEIMNSMKNQNSKSGIFLSSRYSTVYNKECCRSDFGKTYYNLGIGSNYNKDIDSLQPLIDKNLVFIIDGTIYNIDEINEFLNEKNNQIYTKNKENELVFELIKSFYIENNDLLESIKKVIKIIDGDYTFAIFDSENLALVRDSIGIRPLYYYSPLDLTNKFDLDLDNTSNLNIKNTTDLNLDNTSNLNIKSTTDLNLDNTSNLDIKNNYNCFASEKKSFWKMGIDNSKIKTLKPG
ncbi:MAG: hypothetical protein FWE58_02240, partial [Methanobrevibacter sp.]|nr:hypothetical protein [Methanobrevibacter sp.]